MAEVKLKLLGLQLSKEYWQKKDSEVKERKRENLLTMLTACLEFCFYRLFLGPQSLLNTGTTILTRTRGQQHTICYICFVGGERFPVSHSIT